MKTKTLLIIIGTMAFLILPSLIGYGQLIDPDSFLTEIEVEKYINNSDFTFSGNLGAIGNISTEGYYSGQPIDGSIGSGIINSSSNKIHCGCINASDEGGLNIKYPDLKVRIWNYENVIHCDIAGTTVAVPNDAHTVYYVDSACAVQTETWENYFDKDINPSNYARIFDVFTDGGDIEVVKGATVIGISARKSKWNSVNCGGGGHLAICDGIDILTNTFPDFNQTSGHYKYVSTIHTSAAKQASVDGIHLVHHTAGAWVHTTDTGINLTSCDDGTNLIGCSNNQYRRYVFYTLGFGVAGTKIHELVPVDSESYANVGDCLDIDETPVSYTLPSTEGGVAVVHHIYCGRRDDTDWTGSWIDMRDGTNGFGATPDTSIFLTKDGSRSLTGDWDVGNFNITGLGSVGIGTSSPTDKLTISASSSQLRLVDSDDANFTQISYSSDTLAFRMNDVAATPLFVIQDNGEVGVGMLDPLKKFHVNGESLFRQATDTQVGAILRANSATGRAQISTEDSGGNQVWRFGQVAGGSTDFKFNDQTQDVFVMEQNGDVYFTPAGNVGIGTATPDNKFHVETSTTDEGIRITNANSSTDQTARLMFEFGAPGPTAMLTARKAASGTGIELWTYSGSAWNNILTGTYDGKVGIGTTSPTHKLNVVGKLNVTGTSIFGGDVNVTNGNIHLNTNITLAKEGNIDIWFN